MIEAVYGNFSLMISLIASIAFVRGIGRLPRVGRSPAPHRPVGAGAKP